MVDSKKKRRKGSGKVPFLAHLEGIKKMIDAGHPIIEVFEAYENKMTVKEQQFRKYVKSIIKEKPDGNSGRAREEVKKAVVVRTRESGKPAFVSSDTPRDKDSLVKRKE